MRGEQLWLVDMLTLGVVVGDEMSHWGLTVDRAVDSGDMACMIL